MTLSELLVIFEILLKSPVAIVCELRFQLHLAHLIYVDVVL
jgi:hypothetical protein